MRPKPLTVAQAKLVARMSEQPQPSASFEPAVVDSLTVGGAADGSLLATVLWRGSPILAVPYLSSYTPVIGDVVLLLVQGPQAIILGRIAGQPN